MSDRLAHIAEAALSRGHVEVTAEAVNAVFKAMHGNYGKQFLDKYATGKVDAKGHDEGVKSARLSWAHALKPYPLEVVGEAIEASRVAHPTFPPSLGEFEALCKARMPNLAARKQIAEQLRLTASGEAHSNATKEAREAFKAKFSAVLKTKKAQEPSPLSGLFALVAQAIALAGGDEVAELKRLERMIEGKQA